MHSTIKYLLTFPFVVVIVNEHNVELMSVLDHALHCDHLAVMELLISEPSLRHTQLHQ